MSEVVNKVEFGIENLHISIYDESQFKYGNLEKISGITSMKLSAKSEIKNIYADNGVYYSIGSNVGYEGELQIYNFDNEFKKKYFGFSEDANGVLLEPSVLKIPVVALAFKVLGDVKDRVSVLYKCTFSKPDFEWKTLEEKIDVQVMKIKFKATPQEFIGFDKKIIQASTIEDKIKEKWFTEVYKPVKTKSV